MQFFNMFKYLSDILKNFTPQQRILALLILVLTIIILTLGTNIINSNTNTCEELNIRIKTQETEIIQLNGRINELSYDLITNQKECTNNLIQKQKEIMGIVNEMICDAESQVKYEKENQKKMMIIPVDDSIKVKTKIVLVNDNEEMVNKLKTIKKQLEKKFIKK